MKMKVKTVLFCGEKRYYPLDDLSIALCKIKKSPSLNDRDLEELKKANIEIKGDKVSKINSKDLTEEQKDKFTEFFYEEVSFDDSMTSCLWGKPWTHGGNTVLEGETVEEMVKNYIKDHEEEFKDFE